MQRTEEIKGRMGTRSVASAQRGERRLQGEDMEVGDRKKTLKIPSKLPSLQGGIHSLDIPLNQNPVTIKKEPEPSTGEEWIPPDPRESMPRMEDKSVQTLLNIKEEPKSSLEEEWVSSDPRNSFQNPVAVKKETEEKWSVPRLRDKTPCVKVESFEDPVTVKRKLKSSAEKRRIPPGPRKSRKLHMKVESFEDPVTLKRKAEPSPEEEWISTDPGESTLLMDVVEESFEDVTSPAQGDSKEKTETDENEKEAVEESQDGDCDTVYISSEGTYLPKTPSPEGDPDESEKSPPQLSEFERSFLQHLCHTKAEKGPAREVHQCPDCGKTFNFSANLKMHQRFHVKEKPFECLECGRHFTYKSNLESHQIIHSGEKPFRCDECGRYFSYSWTLQKHQKFHEARRGFGEPRGVSSWMGSRNSYSGGAV